MAEIYADFGIEIFDKSVVDECVKVMKCITEAEIYINETRLNTVVIHCITECKYVHDIEDISDDICNVLEPFENDIRNFIIKNTDKIYYASIYFVKNSDEDDVSIIINKRLLNLANVLQVEICFDGF